uniref:FA complementation group A n=1 Tax=Crocodylus porosus TaxID=8502 RepID=A0A7M4EK94_CROPO
FAELTLTFKTDFLAGRVKRRKCVADRGPGLQDAAVRLLSCHQNLNDLFLEVRERGKPKGFPRAVTVGARVKTQCSWSCAQTALLSLLILLCFPVSALQEQASRLGVPLGILSAKTAVASVEQISQASLESGQTVLLNREQRKKLSSLLETIKDLLVHSAFCRSLFCQEIWKMQVSLNREGKKLNVLLLCLLSNSDTPAVVEWLCSSLCLLCEQAEDSSQEMELCRRMLSGKPLKKNTKVSSISHAWSVDPCVVPECFLFVHRLNIFNVTMYRSSVCPDALQQFFVHTLTEVLTYNPLLKVSDAIHMQREWSFARTTPLLTTLYHKLFVAFSAEELLSQLQQVLETHEVNWQHVLSCVSMLVICQVKAAQLVKDLLSRLLTKAFENYDMENIITAFLIVRQAALEGPAVFMPYAEWFKASFGNSSGYHGNNKKALVFLFEFLSELVPFEAPQYLKVHIMHPPFVPAKYRSFLSEYIALAKTRLADLKVSIEDMGLYEDLSTKEIVQPHCQVLQDVEKAIQIFENTGKIPTSVMEASIFRRPYYISRFIPALLQPRVLPEIPDSCMALIDSLKRANKIPPNVYSRYIQDCQAMKKKLVQDGSIEMETDHLKEPFEQLKADLAELRTLITDQSKYSAVPAQIAVISERLTAVLGHSEDENQAASLNSRVQVNVSDPRIEAPYQNVIDLLLTSFCQNLIAASYFNPPDRQGHCPSLFVKMICGHGHLLPALLTRLCQLIYYQGPSLNEAHILGLAAFVVHLCECKSFIPEVDVGSLAPQPGSGRGLLVTEFCDRLLACRTGESLAFCLRFCTAAVSYYLCKFSSLPHGNLCSFLPPGLLKKLQYVVPRLNLEARGTGREEEEVELSWRFLSCPSVSYTKASLCLWKQTHFQELLKEKVFQLSFSEWLLFELEIQSETDILSASERQDFHYWALYEWYLPASSASGGCDGDLEEACGILINAFLDFFQRYLSPVIFTRTEEMVLELGARKVLSAGRLHGREHFLFRVFQARLASIGNGLAVGQQLRRQQELLLQKRILLGLPPPVLITTCQRGKRVTLDCEDFFHFVNSELRNVCSRGCVLSYDITAHFFRGLLSASLDCQESVQGVNDVLATCRTKCPLLLCSAGRWWPRLEPVLCCQWTRLSGACLPQEMQRLKKCQSQLGCALEGQQCPWGDPETPVLALMHWIPVRKPWPEGGKALLSFSCTQEGVDAHETLEWCLEILRHLEERGMSWLVLFHSVDKGHGFYHVLRRAVSDQYIRLLPLAFFSLIPGFHQELFVREPGFLAVVIDSYIQLLQLFVDGGNAPGSDQEVDSLEAITKARQFLLHSIPRCPRKSFTNVHQFLDLCKEFDPEMTAALLHYSKPAADLEYHDGPDLF